MSIFGLAISPHGNVLKRIARIRTEAFRAGDSCRDFGLPEALWTGFATDGESDPAGSPESTKDRARLLAGRLGIWAPRICSGVPLDLKFDSLCSMGGRLYFAPSGPLSGSLYTTTKDFFLESGFISLSAKEGSLPEPGIGFHVANSVTIGAVEAFSFRQFFLSLYRLDSGSASHDRVAWALLARVPRQKAKIQGRVRR